MAVGSSCWIGQSFLVELLFCCLLMGTLARAAQREAICQPQVGLPLSQPTRPPSKAGLLPVCQEFQACTCCNASHAAGIRKALEESSSFTESEACRRWTEVVACRPCDPDVGTGQKPALCRSLCRQWFRSCRTSYFEQSRADSRLVPCRVGALICAQAQELSGGAEEFCSDAGFAVQQQSPCYDGSVPEPHESCRRPQSPSSKHRRQSAQQRAPGGLGLLDTVMKYFPLWGGLLTLLLGLRLLQRSRRTGPSAGSARFPGQSRRLTD